MKGHKEVLSALARAEGLQIDGGSGRVFNNIAS